MVLVLLVVPALVAVQHDVSRAVTAARRGWRFRASGLRVLTLSATGAVLVWFAATMGVVAVTDTLWAPLQGLLGAETAPLTAALGLFLLGAFAVALAGYVFGALSLALRRRRAAHPMN
jgi:ABC-type transport system involved in cytochrome c biogenesis permease component